MATSIKTTATDNLRTAKIISLGSLGRLRGVGTWMCKSTALRLGVTPTRLANGREFISFAEAEIIDRELVARAPQ
jgi:hypothetical protein